MFIFKNKKKERNKNVLIQDYRVHNFVKQLAKDEGCDPDGDIVRIFNNEYYVDMYRNEVYFVVKK